MKLPRKEFLFGSAVAALALSVSAQAVVPGWETDPSAVREAYGESVGYQTPEALRFPYVSTYYVKPTVTPDDVVKVGFFVTDFESSKIRFLDDSHRFTAYLEYRLRNGASTVLTLTDLKSGDAEFDLGRLPVGDYELRVWVKDAKGRESHRVIQDFRVVSAADLTIPADKEHRVTAADLAAYGIRNDADFERIVYVATNGTQTVVKEKRSDVSGYTVTVPLTGEGKVPYRAYEKVTVAYDAGYDKDAAETNAVKTSQGLQKLIDDKAAAGVRKVILPAGTYRVSHSVPICLPDRFTLDLGEATVKLNPFTGEKCIVFRLASAIDAHLVGGTLEGDYWAHDYAGSDKDSEWVSGFEIAGDSWYSSVENVRVRDITGYGGQNGIGNDSRGSLAFFYELLPTFKAGGLDPKTGVVDAADTNRYTTDYWDLGKIEKKFVRRRLQICKYLGYQGLRTRSWQMTVAWYDANKAFLSSETAWQYREMWVPANAAYLRVSVEAGSPEEANPTPYTEGLCVTSFRYPINCAVRNCTFERCRCVGYAASQMKNWIFEGNYFTTSGEAEAKCAFDAEDGADQMQDTYFLGNVFRDNPINNSILTCAGHNFILEKNDGSIHFWGRTHSPCVRDNDVGSATYYCDSRLRSGYARFENNRYSKNVQFGRNDMKTRPDSWDYVLGGRTLDGRTDTFKLELGKAGRAVGCTFRNMTSVSVANAYACTFEHCTNGWFAGAHWIDVTVRDSLFKNFYSTNVWDRCHFENAYLQGVGTSTLFANGCDFTGSTLFGVHGSTVEMRDCTFAASKVEGNWWESPARLLFGGCTIATRDDAAFLRLGVYTVGDIRFEGCSVSGRQSLVDVKDLRPHNNTNPDTTPDRLPGSFSFKDMTWASGATTIVRHGTGAGEALSSKSVTFFDRGNVWPDGVSVVTDLFPTWSLVRTEPEGPEEPTYDWYVSPSGSDTAAGTSRSAPFATVARAVEAAAEGQTVGILKGTYEIDAEITVAKAITLVGAGWETTVIRPSAGKSVRCVTLDGGAVLKGVTLTGGSSAEAGAGVWVKDGTISWCCVSNNATTGGGKSGGGVSFTSGKGAIDHCLVTGNTIGSSSWGGGIGGKTPAGEVLVDTCLVYGNEDKSGSGGGVGFDEPKTSVAIRNCTITGNKCNNGNGHGLYFNNGKTGANLVLVNTILSGNVSGTTECNTFIDRRYFDGSASGNCLITGTQESYNSNIYKDAKVRGLIANVLSDAPTFVNAAQRDYRLARGSAGVRRGLVRAAGDVDLDGTPFAATPSVGCYEYAGLVEAPVFDPASGLTFIGTTNVTLACATEGATVRYTTDGSDPTETGTAYAGKLILTDTTTIRARAFKAGMEASEIVEATYHRYTLPEPPALGMVSVEPRTTTATLSGTIAALGNNGATACDVYLTLDGKTTKVAAGVTDAFRHVLIGLSPETTYAYTLSVSNNAVIPMGASAGGSFSTLAKSPYLEPVPGDPALTRLEVQQALDAAAAASPAGAVSLGEGVFEIDTQLKVTGGVTLQGLGWERTVIRIVAEEASADTRCATVEDGASVVGVTLTGGRCTAGGAGVLVKDGTISWCCISNNAATGGGTSGGGVSFTSGKGAIDHCLVTDNTITGGSWGAGIGGKTPAGEVLVDTCLVYGNEDKSGSGGGIGFDEPKTQVTVRRCTVTDNKCSNGNGHGLYFNNGKTGANLVLVNCLLSHNQAGTSECNLFVQTNTFDRAASSSCLVTGSQTDFAGGTIYKDAGMRNLMPRVLNADPTFVDAARRDYRLARCSPAIGAGTAVGGSARDLDGRRFRLPPSIGCYERPSKGLMLTVW